MISKINFKSLLISLCVCMGCGEVGVDRKSNKEEGNKMAVKQESG